MPDSTYHMSDYQQLSTLFIAALLVWCIGLGIRVIVHDVINKDELDDLFDEIDEYCEDMFLDRDQHNRIHLHGWVD